MSKTHSGKAGTKDESEQLAAEESPDGRNEASAADETVEQDATADRDENAAGNASVNANVNANAEDESAKAVAVDAPLKRRRKQAGVRRRQGKAGPVELSEAQIDSPSKQTLGMLSVVVAATLVMWGVGRAKCNYREVGEGMKPRVVTLDERTRTPKDVAFAFQHALATKDYSAAQKLAKGKAKASVIKLEAACTGGACKEQHKTLAEQVQSVSELLKRTTSHAVARTWSQGAGPGSGKYLLVLEREGRDWKVESYTKDQGQKPEVPGEIPAGSGAVVPETGGARTHGKADQEATGASEAPSPGRQGPSKPSAFPVRTPVPAPPPPASSR